RAQRRLGEDGRGESRRAKCTVDSERLLDFLSEALIEYTQDYSYAGIRFAGCKRGLKVCKVIISDSEESLCLLYAGVLQSLCDADITNQSGDVKLLEIGNKRRLTIALDANNLFTKFAKLLDDAIADVAESGDHNVILICCGQHFLPLL